MPEAIASFGGTPVLLDLSQKDLNTQSENLNKKYNVNAIGFAVDITDEPQVKNNMELLVDKFGKIDCLINNAANNPKIENISENNFSRLENFPLDVWYQDLNVGLTGSLLCSKYYGLQISKNSNGGSIVNISSDLGLISPDQRLYYEENIDSGMQNVKPVSYSVVKSGIIGLTRYLATYWADRNVRCNAICPGGVFNNQKDDFLKEINFRIPMVGWQKMMSFKVL